MKPQANLIQNYAKVMRSDFFVTSLLPVMVATAAAIKSNHSILWIVFPAVVMGVMAIHSLTNLSNEYYDFKRGVDKKSENGLKHLLAEGEIDPQQVKNLMLISFLITIICAVVVFIYVGWTALLCGLIGLAGGYFYTAPPLAYKYRGLGDFFIIILMGPLLGLGTYIALTGRFSMLAIYTTIPAGLLIAATLNSNNIRDYEKDKAAGVLTMPRIIGIPAAAIMYLSTIVVSFSTIVVLVYAKLLSPFGLIIFLSVPLAYSNILTVFKLKQDQMPYIDINTVKLHVFFNICLVIVLIISAVT